MAPLPAVKRSNVPARLEYRDYKQELRYDFFYSCGYCQISECEATTIAFEIDHYEPKNEAPALICHYGNLIYSCKICNGRKNDLYPPIQARVAGYGFFKADRDIFFEHFEFRKYDYSKTDLKYSISGITKVGEWTVDALDLNREILLRIRKIRDTLTISDAYVQEGIQSLRDFPIDQLPPQFRARAQAMVYRIDEAVQLAGSEIDELLRKNAKSDLADPDESALRRAEERKSRMGQLMTQYPGSWRAPRKKKAKKS